MRGSAPRAVRPGAGRLFHTPRAQVRRGLRWTRAFPRAHRRCLPPQSRRPNRSLGNGRPPKVGCRSLAASAEARQACASNSAASRSGGWWPRRLPPAWPSGGWSIPHGTTCERSPLGSCPIRGSGRWASWAPGRRSPACSTAAPNGPASGRRGRTPDRSPLAWPGPTAARRRPPCADGPRRPERWCRSLRADRRRRGSRRYRRTTPRNFRNVRPSDAGSSRGSDDWAGAYLFMHI